MVVLLALLTTIAIIVLLCLVPSPFDTEEFLEHIEYVIAGLLTSVVLLLITLLIVLIGIRESCY